VDTILNLLSILPAYSVYLLKGGIKFSAPLLGNGEELKIEFCINCVVNDWSFCDC